MQDPHYKQGKHSRKQYGYAALTRAVSHSHECCQLDTLSLHFVTFSLPVFLQRLLK